MANNGFLAVLEEALNAENGTVRDSDRLQDLEGFDSIGVLSLIALVEERYGVILDVDLLRRCEKVHDLAMLLDNAEGLRAPLADVR